MPGKIEVDIAAFEEGINELISLKQEWGETQIKAPEISAKSRAFDKLEEICAVYEDMYQSLMDLLRNTISFMANTKNSYLRQDRDAASKMGV